MRNNDSVRAYLEMRLHSDVHEHHAQFLELGGMRCRQVSPIEVRVGDFLYHYSNQLDAFSLYEIVEVDEAHTKCKTMIIDQDSPDLYRGYDGRWESLAVNHCNKFYRPEPADRERAEREGFASMNVPLFPGFARPNARRNLYVHLYFTPPSTRLLGWLGRLFGKE